ncbi:hypothetical protein Tsubulata_016916 [Turnera subulata]|uniref:TPX2 C-terminal domain-containing protein n=1 Tax=Turnera subulata TaxID=218843 RepID=A0A9Q0JGT0_9ROSI|nr:hypothetical protein Tsubulata_016916 [Turnera subulata]
MDSGTKSLKSATPVKDPRGFLSKSCENSNPNVVSHSSPGPKPSSSPATVKSAKSTKSAASKNPIAPVVVYSPRQKIRERKFLVAKKKKSKKEEGESGAAAVDYKFVAYESLRASQEEFFKNRKGNEEEKGEWDGDESGDFKVEDYVEEEGTEKGFAGQDTTESGLGSDTHNSVGGEMGSSTVKRRREKFLEEARKSVPEIGKVMHLVQAFEKLKTLPNPKEPTEKEEEGSKEEKKKVMQWALPGLQHPKVPEGHEFKPPELPEFCHSDFLLTSESLGLDSRVSVSSSWDGSQGSVSNRTSNGGRRSRRNSSESCGTMGGRRFKKKPKATSQRPFNLRTEQRGRIKEEEFIKKMQELMLEEEKQRIPIAQGLPWTTDEPECLIKPPVKESTRPMDLKLHTDIRAVDRAEFDHQVAEKMCLIEQYKMERERLQKLAEEEEVRRLRKELVPKAQPMPYFDRPFIPRSLYYGQRSIQQCLESPSFTYLNIRRLSAANLGMISAPTLTSNKGATRTRNVVL